MYNCLRFCRRLISPVTSEALDQITRHNRFYSDGKNKVLSFRVRSVPKEHVSNFDELVTYISNLHRIQVDEISTIFSRIKDDNLTEKQVLQLLDCCSHSIPNKDIATKHNLCKSVLKKFESNGVFSEKVYESYIKICTDNKQCIDVDSLISSLDGKITPHLLNLILRNVCECGNYEKSLKVLEEMKNRQYKLDESIFNYLILVNTIDGGYKSGLSIIKTMKKEKIKESSNTSFFIIKGLAQRNDLKAFTDALDQHKRYYSEVLVLSLLESLGFSGNHTWAKHIVKLTNKSLFSRQFTTELEKLCIRLIHNGKYEAAFEIYKLFNDVPFPKYGSFILKEMLFCSAPIEKIVQFVDDLKKTGLNEYALENVTETALRNELYTYAVSLLGHFSVVKPHYFWPILINAHLKEGEIGILKIMKTASDMNVKFDFESLSSVIFPRFDLSDSKRVMSTFQEIGYTVRDLLTPFISSLLSKKEIDKANVLCTEYKEVKIDCDKIIDQLSLTWLSTKNTSICVTMLLNISESDSSMIEKFLISVIEKMKSFSRMRLFVELLKDLHKRNIKISSATADAIIGFVNGDLYLPDKVDEIQTLVNDLLDFSQITNEKQILHPKDMNIEQLENHLVELKNKGMETRGVLRKLMQKYASQGDIERVNELKKELDSKGYFYSPGMKTAMLHSYVQGGNLEEAMNIYEELTTNNSTFKIDCYKIIDLSELLIKNGKYDKAVEILEKLPMENDAEENEKSFQRNCLNLLKSVQDIDQQKFVFDLLIERKYCKPNNVILGALVQLHLEKDTLENAVEVYIDLCEKYGKTPMHVVVLSAILEAGKDDLLQRALDVSASIHGNAGARSALMAAMCEKGYAKQVAALLLNNPTTPAKDIEKRCERWLNTNNMNAMQTLLEATKHLPSKLFPVHKIQLAIMQLYSKRNDCDGALAFWKQLVDEEDHVDAEVDREFCELLSRCKFSSPENLTMKYKLK